MGGSAEAVSALCNRQIRGTTANGIRNRLRHSPHRAALRPYIRQRPGSKQTHVVYSEPMGTRGGVDP